MQIDKTLGLNTATLLKYPSDLHEGLLSAFVDPYQFIYPLTCLDNNPKLVFAHIYLWYLVDITEFILVFMKVFNMHFIHLLRLIQ